MSEHWLWPYELGKLEQISGDYEATGKADGRLTEKQRVAEVLGELVFCGTRALGLPQLVALPQTGSVGLDSLLMMVTGQ